MTRNGNHAMNGLTSLSHPSSTPVTLGSGQNLSPTATTPPPVIGGQVSAPAPHSTGASIDPQRLELYYKTCDYLTAQAATADSKALAVLTVEAGLLAALAVAVPLLAPHFPTPHYGHDVSPTLALVGVIVWSVLTLAAIWLVVVVCLCAFRVWVSMAHVLAWDSIDPPPFRKRTLLTVLISGELTPLLRRNQHGTSPRATPTAGLPFDAAALKEAAAAAEMTHLDIAVTLLAHIQAAAAVADGKAGELRSGLLSFLSQAVWFSLLAACWYLLLTLAH